MTSIILFDTVELDAAEGPMGLRVWPPDALEPTLRAYRKRVLEGDFKLNFNGEVRIFQKASHHRGRPKGTGIVQCKEEISQRKNKGMR